LLKENIFLYFLAQRQSRFAKGAGFSRSNHHQRWWLTNKLKNLKFLLYDVLDVVSLTKFPYYGQHNRKFFDMVLDATDKLAKKLMRPNIEEMDRNPPELVNGQVKVHPSVKTLMNETRIGVGMGATGALHPLHTMPHLNMQKLVLREEKPHKKARITLRCPLLNMLI